MKLMAHPNYRKTAQFMGLGVTLLLSGCMGIYEGGFECPPGKGVGCKSISEVNTMVNQEEIPLSESREQDSDMKETEEEESVECSCGKNPDLLPSDSRILYSPWALEEI